MSDLKEVHQRISEKRKEKRKITEGFKEAQAQSKPYQDMLDQMKALKTKKLQIEAELRSEFTHELEQIERMAADIKTDAQLLSDMALTMLMKGETVEIKDENDVVHEPIFKVTFKKVA